MGDLLHIPFSQRSTPAVAPRQNFLAAASSTPADFWPSPSMSKCVLASSLQRFCVCRLIPTVTVSESRTMTMRQAPQQDSIYEACGARVCILCDLRTGRREKSNRRSSTASSPQSRQQKRCSKIALRSLCRWQTGILEPNPYSTTVARCELDSRSFQRHSNSI